MRVASHDGVVAVEFKPKWLAQSPTAPKGARRCRTCALRALRKLQGQDAVEEGGGLCPLVLVQGDEREIRRLVERVLDCGLSERVRERMVDWVLKSELMRRLRDVQVEMDPKGVLVEGKGGKELGTAMSLRDATLFLKVSLP